MRTLWALLKPYLGPFAYTECSNNTRMHSCSYLRSYPDNLVGIEIVEIVIGTMTVVAMEVVAVAAEAVAS